MWLNKKEAAMMLNFVKEQADYIKECHERELRLYKNMVQIIVDLRKIIE